jgi:hypothetical protein
MALDHSCQVQGSPLSERGDDLYETPPVAVEALLRKLQATGEMLPRDLWEPACGKHGNIVDVLRRHGHRVIGSDLVDYGRPDFFARRDFLLEQKAPGGCGAIITNPPFKLAEQFVAHALELCPRVVMLLRLAFMESARRTPILEGVGLKHIFVFRKRMPMMHRAGWEGRKANSGMAFGWFCWDCRHRGATLINRISWERDG